MTIEELLAAKKVKVAEMNTILEENPESMSEETAAAFDALEASIKELDRQIERKGRAAKYSEDQAASGAGRKTSPAAPARPRQDDDSNGFEDLAEFASSVYRVGVGGDRDPRLQVLGADGVHRETGSTDGYMVPQAISRKIFTLMFEGEPDLMSMVDSEPTSSNSVRMLKDEATPWGGMGIQAYWGAEASKLKRSKLETEGANCDVQKVHAFVEASEELLEDAPRLNSRLTVGSSQAIKWKVNEAIYEGSGVGMPLGFMKSKSKIQVAKEGGQESNTIVFDNVTKMYIRSLSPSRSIWLANQDIFPQLMRLKYEDDSPAWAPNNSGIAGAPGGFLMGRPIQFSDLCSTLGEEGDLNFVEPMGYYMPMRRGVKYSSSMHLLFDYDKQCFKWTFRVGGQPFLSRPVSPKHGTNTRSHFVTLAARA